jgi:hypothetical protein
MTDPVKAVAEWISKEPESTEVIIIRRRGGQFHVKIEYGDRTTIPRCAEDLAEALTAAVEKANALPSSARYYGERGINKPGVAKPRKKTVVDKPTSTMPGMTTVSSMMPGLD